MVKIKYDDRFLQNHSAQGVADDATAINIHIMRNANGRYQQYNTVFFEVKDEFKKHLETYAWDFVDNKTYEARFTVGEDVSCVTTRARKVNNIIQPPVVAESGVIYIFALVEIKGGSVTYFPYHVSTSPK
ncbi:hypothetical protein [Chromobacterium rhizoryzae]|uniref:hypothetical protein n=1 Tax=Chromobacterium rhizoryzae TaxID=1778675 RepID=UPI001D0857B3|nr:hypothetical protein [Chromobacterium rhizoryzae]